MAVQKKNIKTVSLTRLKIALAGIKTKLIPRVGRGQRGAGGGGAGRGAAAVGSFVMACFRGRDSQQLLFFHPMRRGGDEYRSASGHKA